MSHPLVDEMAFAVEPELGHPPESADGFVAEAERFTAKVRAETTRLAAARDEILSEARRQAAEFRREADEEIEAVLAEAQARADATVAAARQRAAELIAEARTEAAELEALGDRYRKALRASLDTLEQLPAVQRPPNEAL